jgi:methylmalonyl-CoA mutase
LAVALAMAVEYIRRMDIAKVPVGTAAPRMAFSFAVGSQFFPELAKFRAFRLLWSRVLSAFGDVGLAANAAVHARTALFNKTVLDPYVNMLRTTTEALAAVLGGVDSVQVGAFDEVVRTPDEFSQRIARNIALMLSEEFNFNEVADAAGGSWLVEKLTDDLARKAWGIFQDIEKQGGFLAALSAGAVQKLVGAAAADKRKQLDTRRLSVLGTNLFPNLKEKPLAPSSVAAAPAAPAAGPSVVTVAPVKAWRAAEGYEELRAIADRYAKANGKRPQVFLAKIGPVKQHKPRADFSAGFFAVAGFEAVGKEAFDTAEAAAKAAAASGASIAVLCSTDDTYPVLVPAFAGALKAAKPGMVAILAGLPAEQATVDSFKQAGIDDFIHVRANVREMLAQLLAKIGAK